MCITRCYLSSLDINYTVSHGKSDAWPWQERLVGAGRFIGSGALAFDSPRLLGGDCTLLFFPAPYSTSRPALKLPTGTYILTSTDACLAPNSTLASCAYE